MNQYRCMGVFTEFPDMSITIMLFISNLKFLSKEKKKKTLYLQNP